VTCLDLQYNRTATWRMNTYTTCPWNLR